MNRRSFFRIGAAGAMALPQLPNRLLAGQDREDVRSRVANPLDRAPALLLRKLSTPITGFPTIEPIFGGVFMPGATQTQLIGANGFTALNTQVQTLAAQGFVLASLTAIRNMNATWYYAAFVPGTAKYQLIRTSDPNLFQQTFTANQSGYRLVDFAIAWELNQLYYVGYWLAVSSPVNQTLVWDLNLNAFTAQVTTLTGQGMRMTRVQPFAQQNATAYSALFEAGAGAWAWYYIGLPGFPNKVTQSYPGLTLLGLGYDLVGGNMVGYWGNKVASAQFVWDLDWTTLQATAQQTAASGLVLTGVSAYPNAPDFDDYFAANIQPFVMGYAYSLGYNGQVVSQGYGYSRGPQQPANPSTPFTPPSRSNLASVSKWITAIAIEALILKYPSVTLDTPFWPLISSMVPNPHPSVKTVTLRNLVTMKSGMQTPPNEGPFYGNLWPYLNTYLAMPLVGTPGVTYSYNNENFTILQGVFDQVTGVDYVTWVTQNVRLDRRRGLHRPSRHRLDPFDNRHRSSHLDRHNQRQRQRASRVHRVHQRDASEFAVACECCDRHRQRGSHHADRRHDLDARNRRRRPRPFLLHAQRRALPVVGIRHGNRCRLRGRDRRLVRIRQPPGRPRRHHRTVRYRLRTDESSRARRRGVDQGVPGGKSRGVSSDHRRKVRFRPLRRPRQSRPVADQRANPVQPHRRRSTSGPVRQRRRFAAERENHTFRRLATRR